MHKPSAWTCRSRSRVSSSQLAQDQTSDTVSESQSLRGRPGRTVKLGLYVHGLVRTLGYNVLSVDHGHRQSETRTFFSDKTYRTWLKIGYYVPIFPTRALFCPFFGSFFLITSMSSNLSVSISISRHVFKFTMP